MTPPLSFTCPKCERTSYHPEDIKYGYCGACHQFTGKGIYYAQWQDSPLCPSMCYDVDGNPISFEQWEMLFQQKTLSKYGIGNTTDRWWRIGSDHIGGYWVSTIWTGDDHSFGTGPLEIFETMVFVQEAVPSILPPEARSRFGSEEAWTRRYASKEEALAGHVALCAELWTLVEEATRKATEEKNDG